MSADLSTFAQAGEADLPHAQRWLAKIGVPHDPDMAARMADVVLDGLTAVGTGEVVYPLKIAVLMKAMAALIAAVPAGEGSDEIVAGMCREVGNGIAAEAQSLRKALAKDAAAHDRAARRAFRGER